jgi:hypothetical protein
MTQSTLSSRLPSRAAVAALAVALLAGAAAHARAQAGPAQTEKFVKSIETTMKSIATARQQVEKTVAGYNSIIDQTAKDTKSAYKDLGKDIVESEKKVGETQAKVDEMNLEADRHFAAWKESAASITDPALRKKSEARIADAQERYQKIASAGRDSRGTFDTFITDLKNQSTYLGNDLNAGAIQSLKPDAAKFNTRAKTLFGKIDSVTNMFSDYAASMKP